MIGGIDKPPGRVVASTANERSKLSHEVEEILAKGMQDTGEYDIEISLLDSAAETYPVRSYRASLEQTENGARLTLNGEKVSEAQFKAFSESEASERGAVRRVHSARKKGIGNRFVARWMASAGRAIVHSANGLSISAKLRQAEIQQLYSLFANEIQRIDLKKKVFYALTATKQVTGVTAYAHAYNYKGDQVGIWKGSCHPYATSALSGKVTDMNNSMYTHDHSEACDRPHETHVAEILVSQNSSLLGFAPSAYVYAGSGELTSFSFTSDYVLNYSNPKVYISSNSWLLDVGNGYIGHDAVWDDYVFKHRITTVFSMGNDGESSPQEQVVYHPSAAFNVITVGAYNQTTSPYSMESYSSYKDPDSPNDDREKPELVAPGEHIETPYGNSLSPAEYFCCTSGAAPIVAGMAADLISSDRSFYGEKPEAVKAALMAGAIHNIEGDARLSDKDGAGGVDYRYTQASRNTTYWWQGVNIDHFDAGGSIYQSVDVTAGYRYRVALVWGEPGAWPYDHQGQPQMDLNLLAHDPDGQYVVASYSYDNTYEILDFVPEYTGSYVFTIHRAENHSDSGIGASPLYMALAVTRIP